MRTNGPAVKCGNIHVGDAILQVDGQGVESIQTLQDLLIGSEGSIVTLNLLDSITGNQSLVQVTRSRPLAIDEDEDDDDLESFAPPQSWSAAAPASASAQSWSIAAQPRYFAQPASARLFSREAKFNGPFARPGWKSLPHKAHDGGIRWCV